jgi:glycosyltransferase involved in cell wall biosynthesis
MRMESLESSHIRAFRDMGHEPIPIDSETIYRDASWMMNRYTFRAVVGWVTRRANRRLLAQVVDARPDLILIFKGEWLTTGTLGRLRRLTGAPLFNYNPDHPFNPETSSALIVDAIPEYDYYLTWTKFLVPEILRGRARRVEWVPCGYDPHLHAPTTLTPEEERVYGADLMFAGTWDPEREGWLAGLADYRPAIWGNGWERVAIGSPLRKYWRGSVAYGSELAKAIAGAKIALNFIRTRDPQVKDTHNMRTFEIPACGGFMLTTRTKEQAEFFEEDKEYVAFDDPAELRAKVERYLPDESSRRTIAAAARARVLRYSYERRAEQILSLYRQVIT